MLQQINIIPTIILMEYIKEILNINTIHTKKPHTLVKLNNNKNLGLINAFDNLQTINITENIKYLILCNQTQLYNSLKLYQSKLQTLKSLKNLKLDINIINNTEFKFIVVDNNTKKQIVTFNIKNDNATLFKILRTLEKLKLVPIYSLIYLILYKLIFAEKQLSNINTDNINQNKHENFILFNEINVLNKIIAFEFADNDLINTDENKKFNFASKIFYSSLYLKTLKFLIKIIKKIEPNSILAKLLDSLYNKKEFDNEAALKLQNEIKSIINNLYLLKAFKPDKIHQIDTIKNRILNIFSAAYKDIANDIILDFNKTDEQTKTNIIKDYSKKIIELSQKLIDNINNDIINKLNNDNKLNTKDINNIIGILTKFKLDSTYIKDIETYITENINNKSFFVSEIIEKQILSKYTHMILEYINNLNINEQDKQYLIDIINDIIQENLNTFKNKLNTDKLDNLISTNILQKHIAQTYVKQYENKFKTIIDDLYNTERISLNANNFFTKLYKILQLEHIHILTQVQYNYLIEQEINYIEKVRPIHTIDNYDIADELIKDLKQFEFYKEALHIKQIIKYIIHVYDKYHLLYVLFNTNKTNNIQQQDNNNSNNEISDTANINNDNEQKNKFKIKRNNTSNNSKKQRKQTKNSKNKQIDNNTDNNTNTDTNNNIDNNIDNEQKNENYIYEYWLLYNQRSRVLLKL